MKNSVLHNFFKYVSMNVAGMIGLSCYILADTFFISQGIGPDGLTALNIALPVFNIMNGAGLMIGMGGAARFSILKASGDHKKANSVFTSCFCLASVISIILIFCGLFFSGNIARLLGANDEVYSMTLIYLKVMLLFSPLFMFNNLMTCFVRNDGAPNLAMAAMIVGSLGNIIMDYVFIFPCKLGMFGAIAATAMAPGISLILMMFRTLKGKNSFGFAKTKHMFRKWFDVASLGISSFITEVSSGIVILVFNFIILELMGNVGCTMKNICFLEGDISRRGGTEKMTSTLANALKEDYNVYIFSLKLENKLFYHISENVKIVNISENINKFNFLKIIFNIRKFLRKFHVDCVINVDIGMGIYGILSTLLTDIYTITWEHSNFYNNWNSKYFPLLRKFAAKFSDALVVLTNRDKENYLRNLKIKIPIVVIPNPHFHLLS